MWHLTEKEAKVVMMTAQGYTTAEIAKAYYNSVETIKHQKKHIIYKMQGRNMTHCVALYFERLLEDGYRA